MTSTIAAAHRYRTGDRGTMSNPETPGGMSETQIVQFEDGTKFIVKCVRNFEDTNNEYLSHLVAKVMEVPVVEDFIRVDDLTMIMSFIPGETAVNTTWDDWEANWITPKIRLFDKIIRNIDRNCGNIIRHAETGVVYAIDHALALPEYGRTFMDAGTAYEVYSPDEVAAITTGLLALREVFVEEGRERSYDQMMNRWHHACDTDHND